MPVPSMIIQTSSLTQFHREKWPHAVLGLLLKLFLLLSFALFMVFSVQAQQTATEAPASGTSLTQLADLLENEQTRNQLIEQLRAQVPENPGKASLLSAVEGMDDSLPRKVADSTQVFLTKVLNDLGHTADAVGAIARGEEVEGINMSRWKTALWNLALVIAATIVAFVVIRLLASRGFRWVNNRLKHAPPVEGPPIRRQGAAFLRKSMAVIAALLMDVLGVALAGIVAYGVILLIAGEGEVAGTFESLFVNAFIVVEVTRALVRTVFATRFPKLRLLAMSDEAAQYWNRWLGVLVQVVGYGMLLVVPVVSALFTTAFGSMVALLIMLGVYIYAVRGIWKNRIEVRDRVIERSKQASMAFFGTLMRLFARIWHVLAIIYFTVLLVVSQIDTDNALPFMAQATLQSIVAIVLGLMVSAVLTATLSRRIHLSEEMRTRLPLLEARINSYVPAILKGLRLFTIVVVLLVVLDAWHAFDLAAWLASDSGQGLINMLVHVAIILLFAALSWTILASFIENRLSGVGQQEPSARERTLLSLFRNAALILIITMTALVVLSQIGINIGPLIAGAGVVGLAIGFGAQKLVQDIITGVFIQIENGMNVNDVVEAGGVFGTVEKMTIRSVGLRTLDGGYHLIPFSSVDVVVNHMRDFSYHMGEYTIAHRENVDEAIYHLEQAFAELMENDVLAPEILEEITIPGVTAINERGVTIRVLIKTTPGMQWAVQRGYNRLVKKHFNAANIELPYPHTVVYFGQDKDGQAPAANINVGRMSSKARTAKGRATAAGHTPSRLTPAKEGTEDVLGNELEQVVTDEDNEEDLSLAAKPMPAS